MKKMTLLFSALMLIMQMSLQAQTNLIENWDGNGATGAGSEANNFGWEYTGTMTWGTANGGSHRYRDLSSRSHEELTTITDFREFMVRWDIGGSYDVDYYNYPVTLEAGKSYKFYWDYCWGNTGSSPNMTLSIGAAKDGSDAIASKVFTTSATRDLYRSGEMSFYAPTGGENYLKIMSDAKAWYGATNMSITEITEPSILTGESTLDFPAPNVSKSFTVTPIYLTEDVTITTPTGFSLDASTVASTAGQATIEITFNGPSNSGYVMLTSGDVKDSIYVEGVADPYVNVSEAYLTFDDEITTATFTVLGGNLSEDIAIAAPTGFSVDNATVAQTAGETTITVTFEALTEVKDYITITSGTASERVRVLGYINDAPLYTTGNLISNYSLNSLDGFSGWGAGSKTIVTDTTMVVSGKSYLQVSGSCSGSLDYDLSSALESNTAYRLRAKVYGENFTFYLSEWNIDGSDKVLFSTTENNWVQLDETVVTGDLSGKTSKLYFNSCEGTRGSLAYLDNYELYKTPMFISESSIEFLEGGDQTVAVTAQTLTEDITITAPANFSVSPTTLASTAAASEITVTYTGNATASGYVYFTSGIYTDSVYVEGIADPTLTISETYLTFDDEIATATFTVLGGNLPEDITITAPTGFSVDNATLSQTAEETTITITFDGLTEVKDYITITSGSLSEKVRVLGYINDAPLYTTGNLISNYTVNTLDGFSGWGAGNRTITTDTTIIYSGKSSLRSAGNCGNSVDYSLGDALQSSTYYIYRAMLNSNGDYRIAFKNAYINGEQEGNHDVLSTEGVWAQFEFEFLTETTEADQYIFFNSCGGKSGSLAYLDNIELYKMPIHLSVDSVTFIEGGDSTFEVTAQLEASDASYTVTVPAGVTTNLSTISANEAAALTVSYNNENNIEGYILFDNGTYADSVYVKATPKVVTAISETNTATDLVYINNETINVNISMLQSGEVTYRVYNLQGVLVTSQVNNYLAGTYTTSIEANLTKGAYLVNIVKAGQSYTYKIIK